MKRAIAICLAWVCLAGVAAAQTFPGQLPALNFLGNPTGAPANPRAFPLFSTTNTFTTTQTITPSTTVPSLIVNAPNGQTANAAVTINKGTGGKAALELRNAVDNSGRLLSLYGPLDIATDTPAQYFDTGGFRTKLFALISGISTGAGPTYNISFPSPDATMLSIWADVAKAAQFRCGASIDGFASGGAALSVMNGAGFYTTSIPCGGGLAMGSSTNATFAGQDAFIGYGGTAHVQIGGADSSAPVAQILGPNNVANATTNNTGFLYGKTFQFANVAGININDVVTDSTNPAFVVATKVLSIDAPNNRITTDNYGNPYQGDNILFNGANAKTLTNQFGSTRIGYGSVPDGVVAGITTLTDVTNPTAIPGGTIVSSIDTSTPPGSGGAIFLIASNPIDGVLFNTGGGGHDVVQFSNLNIAAANITYAGGQGTGTGQGGKINLAVAPAGTTGSSKNPLVNYMTIDPAASLGVQLPLGYSMGSSYLTATSFPGATNGAKISACVIALPASGGICDARGLPSGGTIPAMTIADGGVTILGPCGTNNVTGTILISNAPTQMSGFRWEGCNGNYSHIGTEFVWNGNTTDPMFQLTGCRECEMGHFSIVANVAMAPLFAAIGQSSNVALSTNNKFHDIIIEGVTTGSLKVGMRWYGPSGNNDFTTVQRVAVTQADVAAYSLEGSQVQATLFLNSQCIGNDQVNQYCISTGLVNASSAVVAAGGTGYTTGPITLTTVGGTCIQQPVFTATGSGGAITAPVLSLAGLCSVFPTNPVATTGGGGTGGTLTILPAFSGSFTAVNMAGAHNGGADFYLGAPDATVNIFGGNFESSARMITTVSAASTGWAVNVQGLRWSPDKLATDGKVVVWKMQGGLTLLNNSIDSPPAGLYPLFSLEPNSFGTQATAIGNVIAWDTAQAGQNPFIAGATIGGPTQWRLIGNTLLGHTGSTIFPIPDSIAGAAPLLHKTTNSTFSAAVPRGGTGAGCTNGTQTLTVVGGTGTATQLTATVSGNKVTAITGVAVAGAYVVDPTNPVTTTGGGCTASTTSFTLQFDAPLVPPCDASHDGFEIWASDTTAPTFRGAYTGGGAVKNRMICVNLTGWLTN